MSDVFGRYTLLRTVLGHVRWTHLGYESEEEDAILDEMDGLWWAMTEQEREIIEGMEPISTFEELRSFYRAGTAVVVDRPLPRSSPDSDSAGHRELEEVA